MHHPLIGAWILERAVVRDGELDPSGKPRWGKSRTIEGLKIPRAIVEVFEDGRFVARDEAPYKSQELRVFDVTGVLTEFGQGAGSIAAFWKRTDHEGVDAFVVLQPASESDRLREDHPAITDALSTDGTSLTRRVLAVTDGVYLNEHVLTYVRHTEDAEEGEGVLRWLEARREELASATKPENLEALRAAAPKLGADCVRRFREDEPSAAAIDAALALRAEVDRALFMRGHGKKAATYAWAEHAAEQLDALLADHHRAFLSPSLAKAKFDFRHAALLLRHGHHDAVAKWADKTLAAKTKQINHHAVRARACADLLRGDYGAVVDRIDALKKAERSGALLWIGVVARGLAGDVEAALRVRFEMTESAEFEMSVLSFAHAVDLASELVAAVKEHADAVLSARGDPHLAPLLFMTAHDAQRYTRLGIDREGRAMVPVVRDEHGQFVLARSDREPEGLTYPSEGAPSIEDIVFTQNHRPERYVLLALRLQLAQHRKQRDRPAIALLTRLISDRDPALAR